MYTKSKALKLMFVVGFAAVTIIAAWVNTAELEAAQQQAKKMLNLPEGTLELRETQLAIPLANTQYRELMEGARRSRLPSTNGASFLSRAQRAG